MRFSVCAMEYLVPAVGWMGAALFLIAYFLV